MGIGQQGKHPADDRRIGVAPAPAPAVDEFTDEPGCGHAALEALRGGPLVRRQVGPAPRAVDDGREPFLRVVDRGVLPEQPAVVVRKRHEQTVRGGGLQAGPARPWLGRMEWGAIGWFWRGLKGHSVTFAALFASFVLGVSIAGGVVRLLSSLGVHWLYVLILPAVVFTWLHQREARWIPDSEKRKRLARWIIGGSIVLAVVINQIRH